jgi:hypothetical protein
MLSVAAAEIRVERGADGNAVIRGIAIPYGKLSDDLGGFRERFRSGSISKSLPESDVRALVNHNRDLILGRNLSNTLRLLDDTDALRYEIHPPSTAIAEHYVQAVERGDMSGASFRFYAITDAWGLEGGETIRDVIEAEIDDISICTYPAYPDTTAATRSLEHFRRGQPRRSTSVAMRDRLLRLASAE